jgi:hypothetical protein
MPKLDLQTKSDTNKNVKNHLPPLRMTKPHPIFHPPTKASSSVEKNDLESSDDEDEVSDEGGDGGYY